ncbi:sel1 repeat family protein [Halomonas sp. ML-15]|uniref:tetratricopeptide repeat protein n=1 Tax=Halomonas sp. ML-15 TaxID=2773305 RepID=UPI001745C5C1|nr:tetratricopeptide repeat protein [Halomonas sp. ML-15]MBD3895304.1 sel1 repeat family protein [Halomonas sp. ML-15]
MRCIGILAIAALLLSPISGWALDDEAQAAKDEGMIAYDLGFLLDAVPHLEVAAEAGDIDAMYYLGESHRIAHMGMTRKALEWYQRAAEEGEPYAMLRLHQGGACQLGDVCPKSGDDWREAALEVTLPKAEEGDAAAMGVLFYVYNALGQPEETVSWLERASEAGHVESLYRMGHLIHDGYGDYSNETQRREEAEGWYRRAAEGGYPPAMDRLAALLSQQERHKEAWEWMIEASEEGVLDARLSIGWCYLEPNTEERCQVEQDVVKGWAILFAMVEETSNDSAEWVLKTRGELLTAEQREEAEALAEEWLAKEPPLSQFPPRFGY